MPVASVTYEFLEPGRAVARAGATSRVCDALREAIVSLEFRPGEALDKQAIALRLGVSRFPVGEAMTRLSAEGLVDVIPQSGSRVSLIKISDARENMFLRRALEAEAVRRLAPIGDPALIAALRQNLGYQRAAIVSNDSLGFHRFDLNFHAILLDWLGFERVRKAADTARLGLERVRRLLNSRRRMDDTLAEHVAIAQALETRDADAAAKAVEAHLGAVMTELESFARQKPELFADLNAGSETA